MKDAEARYYVFYKPYLTTSHFGLSSKDKRTLTDYLTLPKDVYPVGRLDHDSEGLLILTNDVTLHHKLMHPKFKVTKTYLAQLEGDIDEIALTKLKKGVTISHEKNSYITKPAIVEKLITSPNLSERNPPIRYRKSIPTSWISITISEGKNRQVRKMCASVGFPVLRLHRSKIGELGLDALLPGECVMLDRENISIKLGLQMSNSPIIRHRK